MNKLEPGDTLYIREGKYNEKIELLKSSIVNNLITIQSYNNEKVIIDGISKAGQGIIGIFAMLV